MALLIQIQQVTLILRWENTALGSNTQGNNNTAVGYQALNSNATAGNNTAVGYNALFNNATGNNNVAVGMDALES